MKNEEICLVGKGGRKGFALEAEKVPESWRVKCSIFMSGGCVPVGVVGVRTGKDVWEGERRVKASWKTLLPLQTI